MKFLIDECLHASLVEVAHAAGFAATHVGFLGLAGLEDWRLMERVRQDDYTLVTNNRIDFLKLFARAELHAGLIIIVPNLAPAKQRSLFEAALVHIVHCREYVLPTQ